MSSNIRSYTNRTFPFAIGDYTSFKPNKSDLKYSGNEHLYYLDFAKYAIYSAHESRQSEWLDRIIVNKKFYQNDQWSTREDIETFLMDETGQSRNRIRIKINQVRPMVEMFRGNAERMSINAYAESISKNVETRREDALSKLMFTQEIANEFPALGEVIRGQSPEIGDTPEDTELIFNQTYVDEYVTNINRLIEFSSELNDMREMQVRVCENLAFSGLGVIEEFKQGEHLRKEPVDSEEFFWDRNAKRPDLQDAAFMGRLMLMTAPDILERWQNISEEGKKAIREHASNTDTRLDQYGSSNSIPVYKIFFQDDQKKEVGYVKDEFDQDYLVYLNEKDEFSEGKIWTESDLIDPPKTRSNEKLFKGKKKRKVSTSVIKYCFYIPGEAVSGNFKEQQQKHGDILLDWGPYEYQEQTWMDLSVSQYPFKCYAWSYLNGVISSPIDDVINPQRFINRIMSSLESQINNAGGAGIIYDKDTLDEDEESEIIKNSNFGNPIGIRTRGKGVPNTIGTYDNTVKNGTYQSFQLIPILEGLIKNMTGVNEALRGESTGSDQLVGVTEILMQRGSLMQEPFYNALRRVFKQSHQSTATVGKKIYMDNQRELVNIVGEQGVKVFQISEGMQMEDFRVFVDFSESKEQQIASGDRALTILLDFKLIDDVFFAEMFGRSTLQQVISKLREFTNKKVLERKKAAEEAAAAAQAAQEQEVLQQQRMLESAGEQERQRNVMEVANKEDDHRRKMEQMVVAGQIGQAKTANN